MLAGTCFQIKEFVLRHELEEFLGLRRKRRVHFGCSLNHVVLFAHGVCVAVREHKAFVVVADLLKAQTLCLLFTHTGNSRCDHRADLLAELGHVLRGVIQTAHVEVSELRVVLKAQLFRHGQTHLDQLVVDFIQLIGYTGIQLRPLFKGFLALGAVGAFHVLQKAVEIAGLAAELCLAGCCDLGILHGKLGFLHQIFDDAGILNAQVVFQDLDEMHAVLRLKLGTERTVYDCLVEHLGGRDQVRHILVDIGHLGVVILVRGVHSVADIAEGSRRVEVCFQRLNLLKNSLGFLKGFGGCKGRIVRFILLDDSRDVRALVNQFAEFLHNKKLLS